MHKLHEIDVAKTQIVGSVALNRVGMSNIECPTMIQLPHSPKAMIPAHVDAFVSLDEPQKGIHMSRLFLAAQKALEENCLSPDLLVEMAKGFLKTHLDMSRSAFVKVKFALPIKRKALVSSHMGWKSYPVSLWASVGSKTTFGANLTVQYSSTCPCSAALSRQLIQHKFSSDFSDAESISKSDFHKWLGLESSIAGTPHGQRSDGVVKTVLKDPQGNLDFLIEIIDALENELTTPVQSAVKREDEQEFARLNAANLMFAEDAVRRMHWSLQRLDLFTATFVEANHRESLHPHDAVAMITMGEGFH